MTATYRNATPADAAALDRIFDTTFVETFGHLYQPADLEAFLSGYGISDWEAHLGDPAYAFCVAEVGSECVGYVKLGPMKFPAEPGGPALLVDQLYVRPEYHGAGIAQALMDWAMDEARNRGAQALYLTVFIENDRARRFYDRYGFEAVGRYDFMVGNQADEDIIMRKEL
jgi:ribosomal protein S18 acetylase RimI-like enzyme